MPYAGEFSALATAICWSFTAIFFSEAGRRIGSFRVNSIRLLFAVGIYCIVLLLTDGRLFPIDLNRAHTKGVQILLETGQTEVDDSQVVLEEATAAHHSAPRRRTMEPASLEADAFEGITIAPAAVSDASTLFRS